VRKVVLWGSLAAVLGIVGAVWWLYASRDALVKRAIEEFGPQLAGVPVTVRRVRLEPLDGKGAISGLVVGNPAGYKAPSALTLGDVRLSINLSTLTSSVVHVREISLNAPVVTYERGPGGDNLTAIQSHIDREVARLGGAPGKAAPPSDAPSRKFIIDHIYVRDARISYGSVSLPMPDVHLRDIGKQSNGASAGEVVKAVWGSITSSAGNAASRAGGAILDTVKGMLK